MNRARTSRDGGSGTTSRRVVIVGAGVGGIACARALADGRAPGLDVTLIDPAPAHEFAPSFLWMLDGSRTGEQVSRPIESLVGRDVQLVRDRVTHVDVEGHHVTVGSGDRYPFGSVVLAPGTVIDMERIPGLAERAHHFYTAGAAADLALALKGFRGGRVLLCVPSMPYRCPAAPYEAAFIIDATLRRRGVRCTVDVVTVEPQPMPVAGPAIGRRVVSLLERRGIGFRPGSALREVRAGEAAFEHGTEAFDLMVVVPPHAPPAFLRESGLAGEDGWVRVDPATLVVDGVAHAYAIGDAVAISLANGKPLPKAGVFAHAQAKVVAANIASIARGERPAATFDGHGSCFLEVGGGRAGFASGDFYAEPDPRVRMFPPTRLGHLGKVVFERRWLRRRGTRAASA